jgi:hypothetical protein
VAGPVTALDLSGLRLRHVVMAFAPIPLAFALALTGLAMHSVTLVYVSIAISAIAMPVGGYAAARLFHQLVDQDEKAATKPR